MAGDYKSGRNGDTNWSWEFCWRYVVHDNEKRKKRETEKHETYIRTDLLTEFFPQSSHGFEPLPNTRRTDILSRPRPRTRVGLFRPTRYHRPPSFLPDRQ